MPLYLALLQVVISYLLHLIPSDPKFQFSPLASLLRIKTAKQKPRLSYKSFNPQNLELAHGQDTHQVIEEALVQSSAQSSRDLL